MDRPEFRAPAPPKPLRPAPRAGVEGPQTAMENVILIVHLVLAAFLIALVLLQRSEGGALGIGGGGGGVSSRPATTPVAKATWVLAAAFIATSLALTVLAAQNANRSSVLDRVGTQPLVDDAQGDQDQGLSPDLQRLLTPPSADEDAPGAGSPAPAQPLPTTPPAAD